MLQTIFSEVSLSLVITWYPKFAFSLIISYFVEIGISYHPLSYSILLLCSNLFQSYQEQCSRFPCLFVPKFQLSWEGWNIHNYKLEFGQPSIYSRTVFR